MKFPWSIFEPVLIPLIEMAVASGFAAIPEHYKGFLAVGFSAMKTELMAWALGNPGHLDEAAIEKLGEEIETWLLGKGCPHLMAELDGLFAT